MKKFNKKYIVFIIITCLVLSIYILFNTKYEVEDLIYQYHDLEKYIFIEKNKIKNIKFKIKLITQREKFKETILKYCNMQDSTINQVYNREYISDIYYTHPKERVNWRYKTQINNYIRNFK